MIHVSSRSRVYYIVGRIALLLSLLVPLAADDAGLSRTLKGVEDRYNPDRV